MDAGVVAGSLRAVPIAEVAESTFCLRMGTGKDPATLRVTAARGHLRRHRSSTMLCIAIVALPCIWPHGARNATHTLSQQPASVV
jgi:hypothetical protein